VTNDIQAFINGSKTNYGWRVIDAKYWGLGNIPIAYYHSKDNYGAENESLRPYLEINSNGTLYRPPTVTTNNATNVSTTSASLNGFLNEDGGESNVIWFEYGLNTSYGSKTLNQTKSKNENFSTDIDSLSNGTLYHFRSVANNSDATAYGNDSIFLTKPVEPNNLNVIINGTNSLNISWVKGNGANNTYVERNTTSNWNRGDGTLVYNGTNSAYNDSGLLANTTYYYSAWSYTVWNSTSSLYQFSDGNASGFNKTNASISAPIVMTNNATNITSRNATLNGFLQSDGGGPCTVWFQWGTDTTYDYFGYISNTPNQTKSAGEIFSQGFTKTYLGPWTLRPNANGTYSEWAPNGDPTNYKCVDEAVADDNTTYVSTTGSNPYDYYNIDTVSYDYDAIYNLTLFARAFGCPYLWNLHDESWTWNAYTHTIFGFW
jgi:hypothetical protein